MKKYTLFFILLTFTLTGTLYSQDEPKAYKKIDYIHVNPKQVPAFLDKAKGSLKAAYQQLVDKGQLQSWRLYHVEYPGGEKSQYNFISVASASDLTAFEKLFSDIEDRNYVPASAEKKIEPDFKNSLVKSELWKVENRVIDSTAATPAKYMLFDYMSVTPGKSPDYLMLEDELARPIHVERMNKDIMAGWEVYSLISPGGQYYGYNFATGNFYNGLDDLEYSFEDEVISQNMGNDVNIPELFNTIFTTRDRVRSELSKLVVSTE